MYALDEIAADAENFRTAVQNAYPYKPLYVKLKLVWTCNLRCVMCNHWRDGRAAPLRFERLRPVIDELAELGCRKIHITGGEPTLHPDLIDIIAHSSAHNIRVTMTTNGTLIDKAKARSLADAGLRGVNVSIDSPDRRTHDRVRGVKGSWKQTVKGATYLARYLRAGNVRINTVVGRKNYPTMVDLPDLASDIGAGSINLIPMDIHTADVRPLSKRQIRQFNREIAPVVAEKALVAGLIQHEREAYPFGLGEGQISRSNVGEYAQGYYETHRCYAPWTHALIDHVGQVAICCMLRDRPIIGDLRRESFTEIWTGDTFTALRQRADFPLYPACRQCDMFLDKNRRLDQLIQINSDQSILSPIMRQNRQSGEFGYRQTELIVAKCAKLNRVRAFGEAFLLFRRGNVALGPVL